MTKNEPEVHVLFRLSCNFHSYATICFEVLMIFQQYCLNVPTANIIVLKILLDRLSRLSDPDHLSRQTILEHMPTYPIGSVNSSVSIHCLEFLDCHKSQVRTIPRWSI